MKNATSPVNRVIQSFYARIHGHYDRVNTGITFGLDQHWRRSLVAECRLLLPPGSIIVDLCTGTGKTAVALSTGNGAQGFRVLGADFSLPMLRQGRLGSQRGTGPTPSLAADARLLPLADESVEAVTISFATRNLDARPGDFQAVLGEVHRILRPGGVFIQIETAQPQNPLIQWLYHRFVAVWVSLVSGLLSSDRSSYLFLMRSIQTFDSPGGLSRSLDAAGFTVKRVKPFFFGAACLMTAVKNGRPAE
jgi:demethylmenaquinone methyltransferase/2-methoxy-6-polyprenyl-1,4-benzoquinol methylase